MLLALITASAALKTTAEAAYFVVSYPPCYGPYTGLESTNAFILPLTQAHDIKMRGFARPPAAASVRTTCVLYLPFIWVPMEPTGMLPLPGSRSGPGIFKGR